MSKFFRVTIGSKLVSFIGVLLIATTVGLVVISSRMFSQSNVEFIRQMNADSAGSLSVQIREFFEGVTEKMRLVGVLLLNERKSQPVQTFFEQDQRFLAVYLQEHGTGAAEPKISARAISPQLLDDGDGEKLRATMLQNSKLSLEEIRRGEVQLETFSTPDGLALAIAVPLVKTGDGFSHSVLAILRYSSLERAFGETDLLSRYVIDRKGRLLAHSDSSRVLSHEDLSYLPIVQRVMEGQFANQAMTYTHPQSGEVWLAAYQVVGFAGLSAVVELPEIKAYEMPRKMEKILILLGFVILCLAFWGGYIFSGTLTHPVRRLVAAAQKIASGDFQVRVTPKGRDEIAHLSTVFNEMAHGLEERERVKETFKKFHDSEIAEQLMSGTVKLGGEKKTATVFFSDVRGFTALSESMTPEEVVEMLNEYMTAMVSVIRRNKGVVDKYVGDAIMAVWGIPLEKPEDSVNAVRACLEMREELARLNEKRLARGQPALKIGMGLNRGEVIAGNIGSDEKMEYTVIGDAVNLASRVESMTKAYGTDLLISKNLFEAVKGWFLFERCESAKVKGKTDAVEVFKVHGFLDAEGKPVLVSTPYSEYTAEKSDKVA